MGNSGKLAPETLNAQALRQIDAQTGGLTPGIFSSTTYVRDRDYERINPGHGYGRDENPGFVVAEKVLAASLGGVEGLIEHRYSIEGAGSPIPADLIRLSTGIESVDDLISDLEQALA